MAAELSAQLIGSKEVLQMLAELPKAAQSRVMRPILAEGSKMLAEIERGEAPKFSGLMQQAIGATGIKTYGRTLFATGGVRRGYRRALTRSSGGIKVLSKNKSAGLPSDVMADPVKYLHIVTGGRKAVSAKPGKILFAGWIEKFLGKTAAATTPNPFMSRAFATARSSIVSMAEREAGQRIEAEAAALGKS